MNKLDIAQVAKSFAKARQTYKQNAIVQEKMRLVLIKMLKKYGQKHFDDVFEFGVGNGEFSEILQAHISYKTYIANDINPINLESTPQKSAKITFDCVEIFDINRLQNHTIFGKRFDLIASNACLQWTDTHKTLQNLVAMLKPKGILCLSTFGEQNLIELAQIAQISLNYANLNDIKSTLENACGLEILDLCQNQIALDFGSSFDVFKHLQKSGVNALKSHQNKLNKSLLNAYYTRFGGKITYHPIYIFARKKC